MKRRLLAAAMVALTLSTGMSTSQAQDGPPQFRPVELWACTFRDGKDQDDMDDVYKEIEEDGGDAKYAAYQLNPYFAGNLGDEFDFIYIGVWDSGSEMGSDLASYLGNNSNSGDAWDKTVDCGSSMYASMRIQAPPQNDSGNFILTVSDCNVDHGNSNGQALGAIRRFNDYRVANGVEIGTIAWFPVYGGGDADFDFKLLNVFTGPQHMGDSFSWYTDNAAYNVESPMVEGVVDCDESRLYIGRTIMNNMM